MTDAELQAIRERCEKATAGPWAVSVRESDGSRSILQGTRNAGLVIARMGRHAEPGADWEKKGDRDNLTDGRFIACARTDIPNLLAEIDRLRRYEQVLAQMAAPATIEQMLIAKDTTQPVT